jgi:hypothetical protein
MHLARGPNGPPMSSAGEPEGPQLKKLLATLALHSFIIIIYCQWQGSCCCHCQAASCSDHRSTEGNGVKGDADTAVGCSLQPEDAFKSKSTSSMDAISQADKQKQNEMTELHASSQTPAVSAMQQRLDNMRSSFWGRATRWWLRMRPLCPAGPSCRGSPTAIIPQLSSTEFYYIPYSSRLVKRLHIRKVVFRKLLSSLDSHSIQFKTVPKDYYETCWELPQWTFCARAS